MNEELQNALAEMLRDFAGGIGETKDFALEQAPDVIQQLLLKDFVFSFAAFLFALLLSLTAALIGRYVYKHFDGQRVEERQAKAKEDWERGESWTRFNPGSSVSSIEYDRIMGKNPQEWRIFAYAIWAFSGVALIMSTAINDWVFIWLAPKVYLIEYAAGLAG